jgi:hypothetical protein
MSAPLQDQYGRRIAPLWIRKLLALVLAIAGSKLAFL